jgi:putative tryptophan/tyrosine transport system substrate-binding protein
MKRLPRSLAVNRRRGLGAIAGSLLVSSFGSRAAKARRAARVGTLFGDHDDAAGIVEALRPLGYEEGRSVVFVSRRGDGNVELAAGARELVAAKVDVIVAGSTEEALAARQVTTTIPIVMVYGLAPVEMGLVQSLARPGGNVTGTAAVPLELSIKSVGLFRSAVPTLKQLAILGKADEWGELVRREIEQAAHAVGIQTRPYRIGAAADLDQALLDIEQRPPDGMTVGLGLIPSYDRIVDFAAKRRLPAIYPVAPAVIHWGGLMSYSPNFPLLIQRTAAIVHRIIQGAKAQDTPVEQPTQYAFAINLKTARAMGFTFPQSVVLSADIVIQ